MAKIELLKEAYAIIDGIPEQAFDLEKIITDGGTSVGCGTVACAAGWLSIHPKFGKLLGADVTLNGESTTIYWPGGQWWDDAVGKVFKLDTTQVRNIFASRRMSDYDYEDDTDETDTTAMTDKQLWQHRVKTFLKSKGAL
jgi:hypothetical protein